MDIGLDASKTGLSMSIGSTDCCWHWPWTGSPGHKPSVANDRFRACQRNVATSGHRQRIDRAPHRATTKLEHMGVNHRGRHIGVSQQVLNGANVIAGLQQMGMRTANTP